MKIQRLKKKDITLNGLLFGPSGSGKTYSISTCTGKVLVIDTEDGLLSIRDKDIDVFQALEMKDLKEVLNEQQVLKEYDFIFVDSLSELAEVTLQHFKKKYKDGRKAYGDMNDFVMAFVRHMRKFNTIFICKEERLSGEGFEAPTHVPYFPGKTTQIQIPYMVDFVAAMRVKQTDDGIKRAFQFEADESYPTCKNRLGVLSQFEFPNWDKVMKKIKKGEK